jgi:DNA-binding NtrC family response regulator
MARSRMIAGDLARLWDDSVTPIYVLDDDRRIVFCNAACARWAGTKVGELLGQQCVYHTPAVLAQGADVAAGLCPPPEVFSGQRQTAVVSCAAPDGRLMFRRGHFFPLDDGQNDSAPVLAILEQHDCECPACETANAAGDAGRRDLELHELVRRFRHEAAARYRTDSLIGGSPAIARAREQIELAAGSNAHVLIVGPQGAGKEHAAKAIHYAQREPGGLTPLACAVLEPNALRATLRSLNLRNAESKQPTGTLLLSDVDCLAAEAQRELAEMLASRALRMRVIATASQPLAPRVAAGEFSRQLAYALSTITIELPPLVERLEDLPLLAQAFLEEANAKSLKQLGRFTPEALDRLAAYPWPGNVDELAAMAREAHARAHAIEVDTPDLPERIALAAEAASHPPRREEPIVLEDFLARVEKELIVRALRRAKGNKSKAAKLLGLTRPRLYRRLIQLGLEQPDGQNTP